MRKGGDHLRLVHEDKDSRDEPPWRSQLSRTKTGSIKPTSANIVVILRNHPQWKGVLRYNEFLEAPVTVAEPPWHMVDRGVKCEPGEWRDTDTDRLVCWLSRSMKMTVGKIVVDQAIGVASEADSFHPVRDELDGLTWDRKKRLDRLVPRYFGGEDNDYTRFIGAKWMISAVARIFKPGCQVDHVLVVETQLQGRYKSAGFRALVGKPEWFSETPIDISSKDGMQSMRGIWICSLDELDAVRRAESTKTKNFLTRPYDRYRESYGRRTRNFARQCVFCGTTNESEYLADIYNRRYWPFEAGEIDLRAIERDREQLWAEAVYRYKKGEPWWPDTEKLRTLCEEEQAQRRLPDDWQGPIGKWCRRNDDGQGVLTADVLTHALSFSVDAISVTDTMRVARVLRLLGYHRGPQLRDREASSDGVGRPRVRRYVLADEGDRAAQEAAYEARSRIRSRQ